MEHQGFFGVPDALVEVEGGHHGALQDWMPGAAEQVQVVNHNRRTGAWSW